MGASPMAPRFYSQRNGEYVYDVTVTKDETVRPSHRYRAHLSNVQRLECGRLAHVQVDLQDTRGNGGGGGSALEACFETWRQQQPSERQ